MTSTLILGGAGFIGRHLAYQLSSQPQSRTVVFDHARPGYELPQNVEFVQGDVRKPIAIDGFKPDLVVNLAAIHRTPGHPDNEYHETNEAGAEHAVHFCTVHDVQRLWFTSSIAVYGPSEQPVDEQSELAPVSAYGKSKVRAEEIHQDWVEQSANRRLVIVRPATVFGPGEEGNFVRLAASLRTRTFFYPGRRTARKACGYVADLIGSLPYMEQYARPSVTYNFAYPEPPTIEQVCDAISRIGDYPRPLGTIPTPFLLAAARVLTALGRRNFDPERVMKLVNSTNVVPGRLIESGYTYRYDLVSALEQWYQEPPRGVFS
jgi:nucleoside-diphosphate-sugar epimerase